LGNALHSALKKSVRHSRSCLGGQGRPELEASAQHFVACLLLLALLGGLASCATVKAPVSSPKASKADGAGRSSLRGKHTQHTVAKGDTLYSIAWRYGYDHKTLAAWNRIKAPFTIYPGQVIRFKPSARQGAASPTAGKQPRAGGARPGRATQPKSATGAGATALRWRWPVRGKLLKSATPIAKKGVSIGGRAGQKITAAAGGVVVYSGNGLRGYGNLIIIKHNNTYLSAYAHNRDLVVREGQTVTAGQQIATMGVDGKGTPLLHFEIRKNGKPIDPRQRLPR